MANGHLQAQFENVPGNETNNPTLSTKQIFIPSLDADWNANVEHLERDDELRNQDEPLAVVPETYEPDWEVESRMYPDTLAFFLKAMLGNPVTTAGNGVIVDTNSVVIPTGAYRHTWTAPFTNPAGASPQTMQMQYVYGNEGFYSKVKGAATEKIDFTAPEKGGARIKASGPALYAARVSDPALSPAYEALTVLPFMRRTLQLSWLSGTATTEDFSFGLTNPVEVVRSLAVASAFPDVMEKAGNFISLAGKIDTRHIDSDDWDALINATGFAGKATFETTNKITGTYPYKFIVSMSNCQLTGGSPESLKNERRAGASYDWRATSNGSSSVSIQVVNATASYA